MVETEWETEETMLLTVSSILERISYPLEFVRQPANVWHICYRPCEPLNTLPTASSWVAAIIEFRHKMLEITCGRSRGTFRIDDVERAANFIRVNVARVLPRLENESDGPDTADL